MVDLVAAHAKLIGAVGDFGKNFLLEEVKVLKAEYTQENFRQEVANFVTSLETPLKTLDNELAMLLGMKQARDKANKARKPKVVEEK